MYIPLKNISLICASVFKGKVGITLNVGWAEPEDPYDPEYLKASERDVQFNFGWFAHPILVDGRYPNIMVDRIRNNSNGASRLPQFPNPSRINGMKLTKNQSLNLILRDTA